MGKADQYGLESLTSVLCKQSNPLDPFQAQKDKTRLALCQVFSLENISAKPSVPSGLGWQGETSKAPESAAAGVTVDVHSKLCRTRKNGQRLIYILSTL